jgi:hypothetical protein
MEFQRFETTVVLETNGFEHKGVVYYAKVKDDRETIVLAENHRWREGFLMLLMTPKDIDAKEAHRLINNLVNSHFVCQRCLNDWDGAVTFRIDVDLRKNMAERIVCAYCDPVSCDIIKPFDYQEVVRTACKHKRS